MNGQVNMLTIKGKTRSAKAWSKSSGAVSYTAILYRVRKGMTGWSAVFAPLWDNDPVEPVERRVAPVRRVKHGDRPWLVRSQFGSVRSFPLSMLDLLRKHS